MRLLLLLSLLLAAPLALAQEGGPAPSTHGQQEPALVPSARPALVVGEITTERFRILYTARSKGSAQVLAEQIERVRDSFLRVLGRDWPGKTEIRMGMGREEYEALALPGGAPPKWAVALAYPTHGIILLNALSLTEPDGPVTLRHELAHVALGQFSSEWPRWFQEGIAQHLTGERINVAHYAALFRAVTQEKVLHFEDLSERWPDRPTDVEVAYAQSADFVAWLAGQGLPLLVVGGGEHLAHRPGHALRLAAAHHEHAARLAVGSRALCRRLCPPPASAGSPARGHVRRGGRRGRRAPAAGG
jgi:hypothetical protein